MKIFSHDAVVRTPPNACEMFSTKPSMELVFHAGPCAGKSPLLNSPLDCAHAWPLLDLTTF